MPHERHNLILNDMAAELGLSKSTVSRALSGNGRISDETRRRVVEYAESHGFTPNSIASSLARSQTNNIGVVIPTEAFYSEIPFFHECLMGVCEASIQRDYDVLIAPVGEGNISVLKRIVSRRKVDGILLTRSLVVDYPADYLKAARIPFVTVGSSSDANMIQVDTDTTAACKALTLQVLERNSAKLALILGPLDYIVNQNRLDGFHQALAEAGRAQSSTVVLTGVSGGKNIREACRSVAQSGADCIICGDDFICAKAVEQLREDGRSDIPVSSYYNSDILRNLPLVDLVMSVDVHAYGIASGNLLIDLIENKPVPKKTFVPHVILQYKH
ncbi:MAG: LacI family DNA-binding transcriptional regulator [Christensenella sp.]|nr:LacI family DNA-binding transcriptional regulator [Christensenella sp.]